MLISISFPFPFLLLVKPSGGVFIPETIRSKGDSVISEWLEVHKLLPDGTNLADVLSEEQLKCINW